MEKVVIFGSTGMTGTCVTSAAIERGYSVTVLVRDETKLDRAIASNVNVIQGNVLNYEDVFKAVQGSKAVVVTLGTRNDLSPTTDLSDGLKNIIKAMKETNIEVIAVCLSAFLFPDFSDKTPPRFAEITKEHQRMLDAVLESDLKYIAVLPPHIADQPPSGYKVEHNKYLGRVVSKHDLGAFLVEALEQPEHYGRICGIISVS